MQIVACLHQQIQPLPKCAHWRPCSFLVVIVGGDTCLRLCLGTRLLLRLRLRIRQRVHLRFAPPCVGASVYDVRLLAFAPPCACACVCVRVCTVLRLCLRLCGGASGPDGGGVASGENAALAFTCTPVPLFDATSKNAATALEVVGVTPENSGRKNTRGMINGSGL